MINTCPNCRRKLISRASSCCNWCGYEIEDPAYQAEAQAKREASYAQQALHDAQSLASFGFRGDPWSSLIGGQIKQRVTQEESMRSAARAQRAQAKISAHPHPTGGASFDKLHSNAESDHEEMKDAEADNRFRHLEL